jgi:hypothetical protein
LWNEELPSPRTPVVVALQEQLQGAIRTLNRPQGEYVLEDLDGEGEVVITGKVRTLVVGTVDGRRTVDATQVQAESIIIKGKVDGSGEVRLHCPKIEVQGTIMGGSRAAFSGGTIIFHQRIGGGAKVQVEAREVDCRGILSGGAHIKVTVAYGGTIKFAAMEEGAYLFYRKAQANDPEPVLLRGTLSGGATVKRDEPAR